MRARTTRENKEWEEKNWQEKLSDLVVIGFGLTLFLIMPVYNIVTSLLAGKILEAGFFATTYILVWVGVLAMLLLFNGVRT